MDLTLRCEVSIPQLTTLTQSLDRLGVQLMADFALFNQRLDELKTAIQVEAQQVLEKLNHLAQILAADAMDQQHIDVARSLVEEMIPSVKNMVPDEPVTPPVP